MDAFFPQMLDESRVLATAHPVTDAQRMQRTEGFPDAFGAACLTGVSGTWQVALFNIAVGRDMGLEREASLVTRQVERSDMRTTKTLNQPCRVETLFGCEVAQRTEN